MMNIPKSDLYICHSSTEDFSETEKNAFEEAFSEETIGVDWWYAVEHGLNGIENFPIHVFFYDSQLYKQNKRNITAIFSAQYFPALTLLPHVEADRLSSAHRREITNNAYACLMIHAFSSVSSLWYGNPETFIPSIELFVNEFAQRNPLHITFIRNLTEGFKSTLLRKNNDHWYIKDGLPRYVCYLSNCNTIEDYFKKSVKSRKRRNKLRASMRKLALSKEYSIFRITTVEALRPYTPQIMKLKLDTYKRNASQLSIPLMEDPAYFNNLLTRYKNKAHFYILQDRLQNVIGYLLAISSEKITRAVSIGIQLPRGREVDAWYTLQLHLFSSLIEERIVAVNLGLAHGDLKIRIGSQTIPLFTAMRFNTESFGWDAERFLAPQFRAI